MVQTRRATAPKRAAEKLQARLDSGAYEELDREQLQDELVRRILTNKTHLQNQDIISTLRYDDKQSQSLPANEYQALLYTRSGQLPPFLNWDRSKQDKATQQAPNYGDRLTESKAAAIHKNTNLSFMTLPAELRNNIYNDLFASSPTIVQNHRVHPFVLVTERFVHTNNFYNPTETTGKPTFFFGHEHALLRTCKTIRNDALAVWYGNREYRFSQSATHLKNSYDNLNHPFKVDEEMLNYFDKWASPLGDGRLKLIRKLYIEVDAVEFRLEQGVFCFDKMTDGRFLYKVKDVAAVVRAILKVLRRNMDTSALKVDRRVDPKYVFQLGLGTLTPY